MEGRVREVVGALWEDPRGEIGMRRGPLEGCAILAGWVGNPVRKMEYCAAQLQGWVGGGLLSRSSSAT